MHCGQLLSQPTGVPLPAGAAPIATSMPVPAPNAGRRGLALGIVAGLAVVLLGAFGLNAAGILKLQGGAPQASSLEASGSGSRMGVLPAEGGASDLGILPRPGSAPDMGVLKAQGSAGRPVLLDESSMRMMPADVRRWLEHLERIERRRVRLTESQLAQAVSMFTLLQLGGSVEELQALLGGEESSDPQKTPPTIANTQRDLDAMRSEWTMLTSDFNALPPPQECALLRNEYDQVVRETGAMILDIVSAVAKASEDRQGALQTLLSMRGKSAERIGAPATRSDELVQAICDKYGARKWFTIVPDIGGGGLMDKLGF
jgi:hypothetical protein